MKFAAIGPLLIGLFLGMFAVRLFADTFDPQKMERVGISINNKVATTPEEKVEQQRTLSAMLGGMSLFCFLFAFLWYAASSNGGLRLPLGLMMTFVSVLFLGLAVHLAANLDSPGNLRIKEDGASVKDPERKKSIARFGMIAFGGGGLFLGILGLRMLWSLTQEDGDLRERMEQIPCSPSFALAALEGHAPPISFLATYAPTRRARRSAIPWSVGTVAYLGLALTSPLWFRMPWIATLFFDLLGLVFVSISLPLLRTYLALKKVRLHLSFPASAQVGHPFDVHATIEARVPVRIDAIKLLLIGGRETGAKRQPWKTDHGQERVIGGPLTLRPQETRELQGSLKVPSSEPGMRWIVAVVVDISRWPDLEVAR